ncbi:hypothetical protein Q7P37_003679 [Cladosporium fusiforme]
MTAPWSQTSLPEDQWYTGSAQDHSTYVQTSSSEWDSQTLFSSAQDFSTLESFRWTNTNHGPVDMGLSPVLSQQSQSLNSLSEPELPAGLDLSFTYEPTWDNAGSMMAQETQTLQRQLPGSAFVPSLDEMPLGNQMDDAFAQWPMSFSGCSTQPLFYSGQTARPAMRSPAVAAPRTLLPRTEGSIISTAPAFAQSSLQRANRSSIQGRTSSRRSSQSVSNVGFAVHGSPRIEAGQYLAPRSATSDVAKRSSVSTAMDRSQAVTNSTQGTRSYTQDSSSAIMDPAAEEFSAFIQYDQEEQTAPVVPSRSDHRRIVANVPHTNSNCSHHATHALTRNDSSQETVRQSHAKMELDVKAIKVSPKAATALPSEVDEGRHRNHPLYAQGPDADGMFRCPFRAKENCPHKATKLKCNYEYESDPCPHLLVDMFSDRHLCYSKFVDSHLKPFRCRQEACAKQEFSSTACLLRHEREAHGMHGHGDRPHLCFYSGCDRGLPGNGFPRRYNLFDHMKRVHDHKEDTNPGLASPEATAADASGQRKSAGRKRKAPSSAASDSAPQRQKTMPQQAPQVMARTNSLPYQEVMPMSIPGNKGAYGSQGYQYPVMMKTRQDSHSTVSSQEFPKTERYQQWTSQGNPSARNYGFVQSPDAPLFDGSFQDMRRLSDDTRYG